MAKEGGSRSKTTHYHHKLNYKFGTFDFGFVLTWPTSSWSSCSTVRETVAFYEMKPGWSWCRVARPRHRANQRWQRYKAMASGQRFKATFGALPRTSGMQFLGKDRWLHLERSAPNRRPPTEIFDQQTKSVFGMTPYSPECLISTSQDVVFNHQPPNSNCRVAHSDWPGPNIWIWHSSFEVENRPSSCCHFQKILGEASGQVF